MLKKYLKLLNSHHIKLIEKREEAQNAYSFRFEKPADLEFEAGQHFIFRLPHGSKQLPKDNRGDVRIFSISSSPSEGFIQFTTRYFGAESSSFKKALFNLKSGETINLRGPSPFFDNFKIIDFSRPYLYIVGGIGVTPLMSVLSYYDHSHAELPNLQSKIFYINRDEDFIFGNEINQIIGNYDGITMSRVISPERLDERDIEKAVNQFEKVPTVVVSGSPGFVKFYTNLIKNSSELKQVKLKSYKYNSLIGGGY